MLDEDTVYQLIAEPDLAERMRSFGDDEIPIEGVSVADFDAAGASYDGVELRTCVLRGCGLSACSLAGASFIEVDFLDCDFSNADLSDAYFNSCTFLRCKCVGAEFGDSTWRRTAIRESDFKFAGFAAARLRDVDIDDVDFTEAVFNEVEFKRVRAQSARFVRNELSRARLGGFDFSDCELRYPVLSDRADELRGTTVGPLQAADIIGSWGVLVKGAE